MGKNRAMSPKGDACPVPAEERAAEYIQIDNRWYILATSSLADVPTRVLKHGDTFAIFNRHGDFQPLGLGEQGLYHRDTRFLNRLELRVNDRQPLLLNSTVKQDNSLLQVDLTTPDIYQGGRLAIPKGTLHISRTQLLWEGVLYDRLQLVNYGVWGIRVVLELQFGADFADIFEVRGSCRVRHGTHYPLQSQGQSIRFTYQGLDQVWRGTRISFSRPPDSVEEGRCRFALELPPRGCTALEMGVACELGGEPPEIIGFSAAAARRAAKVATRKEAPMVFTVNEQFNDWLNRSAADLHMLATETEYGVYPYAGVPWFSAPFGRDGIITALMCLWLDPGLARGVLAYLAATQAEELRPEQDAQPGKILHEARQGEMARLGEVPFRRYYGSVDATPLFVVLAGAYYQRTGELEFIQELWPQLRRALEWMNRYGDLDGDGLVEYCRSSPDGLVHQGWKDSGEAVFHADGGEAPPPIALCEVQGYVYKAKCQGSRLALLLGEEELAWELNKQAQTLRENFNRWFWMEDLQTYALALDGQKRPCRVRASNAGHALWSGIAEPDKAARLAQTLMGGAFFSGWGIRTLATTEACYNPMSYHNGSVWPHDNALIAMGLARYGFKEAALKILTAFYEASLHLDLHRLPELFCGFDRLPGQGPTLYPVACAPQAWASGAVFYLLQACLGLTFSPDKPQIYFVHPRLPEYLPWLEIRNLRIGHHIIDLILRRHPQDVGINVRRKEGDVEVGVLL